MANLLVYKETALPGSLTPHSVYFIAPAARPDFVEIYVTNAAGDAARKVIDQATVQGMIDAAVAAGSGGAVIVSTLAERNALTPENAQQVLVIDASADATVESGAATYVWREATTEWIKISEAESLDVSLAWADIAGRPSSTPAQIDTAVTNSHTHANKTQLDLIGQDAGGNLTYNGSLPHVAWDSTGW